VRRLGAARRVAIADTRGDLIDRERIQRSAAVTSVEERARCDGTM